MEVLQWTIPKSLNESCTVKYREIGQKELVKQDLNTILMKHVYLSPLEMERLVRFACKQLSPLKLKGTGLELGAGCGLLSSVVAKNTDVERVYAVEVVENNVRYIIPRVAKEILGDACNKIIPVIGTFDTLELPDNSVDFILEIDSLHHSDNLVKTLKESARVLKKEGVLIAIDRCHPNSFTDKEVEKALGITYSNEFLKSNGYPQNIILTRRDNGEHEYRLFEYENAFNKAGLEIFSAKVFVCYKIKFKHALKGILSLFPKQLTQLIYKSNNKHLDTPIKWLKQSLKIKNKNQLPESGERTLFILNKK